MCNRVVNNYAAALEFVPDCYKTQKIRDKAVDIYSSSVIKFVPEYYKTQKMCDKAVYTCPLYFILFLVNIRRTKCVIKLFPKIILC